MRALLPQKRKDFGEKRGPPKEPRVITVFAEKRVGYTPLWGTCESCQPVF